MWRYAYPEDHDDKPAKLTWALVLRVLSYAKPYKQAIVILLVLILVQTALGLVTPLVFRDIIDITLPTGDAERLNLLGFMLLFVPILSSLFSIMIRRINSRIGEGVIYDLRRSLYAHIQGLSLRFFTHTQTGELMSRLNSDVVSAQNAISDTIVGTVTNIIHVIFVLAVMLTLDWRLTLLGLIVFPIIIFFARKLGGYLRSTVREAMDINAQMNAMMNETLNISGALLVKLFGRKEVEINRFDDRAAHVRDIGVKRAVLESQFWAMVGLVVVVGTALVYWGGGHLVLSGTFSIGTLVAFGLYLQQLYGPLEYLTHVPMEFANSSVSFERVFEVIDLPLEIDQKPDAIALSDPQGEITFDNVSFKYEVGAHGLLSTIRRYGRMEEMTVLSDGEEADESSVEESRTDETADAPKVHIQAREQALSNISFQVKPGQLVALVGPSGAGKTSLTYLIPRLYDPTEGRVLLDGIDLRDLTLDSLGAVGMVTQETYLFHDTIRMNLTYAKLDATQAEIEAACKIANIHDFIRGLPQGYNTLAGERGHRLSGGEKQRIAIARVILKDPRILVLDEATSHLDSQSEALIQEALERIMVNRTSIVIAHRLSTVLKADLILVMDRGQIVEQGTHQTLLAHNGLYAHLYATQFTR